MDEIINQLDIETSLSINRYDKDIQKIYSDLSSGIANVDIMAYLNETINKIYSLVNLINDIYKNNGYEEPFGMIAKEINIK